VNERFKKGILFSLLATAVFLAAGTAILRLTSAHRIKPSPTRLEYSIYCVNRKYLISSRPLDEMRPTGGAAGCAFGAHDNLAAAESYANDLGGVGSTCSCDEKLYAYCVNRRIEVSKIPPADMREEPGYGEEVCEQPDDSLTQRPGPESPGEQPRELPGRQASFANSCECQKSAAAGGQDEEGGSWAFLGLGVVFVALLIFLRVRHRYEPPADIFHTTLSK
jgi:hypothetical protein